MITCAPVSYTHLDVYKRQGYRPTYYTLSLHLLYNLFSTIHRLNNIRFYRLFVFNR